VAVHVCFQQGGRGLTSRANAQSRIAIGLGGLSRLSESVLELVGADHCDGRVAPAPAVGPLDPVATARLAAARVDHRYRSENSTSIVALNDSVWALSGHRTADFVDWLALACRVRRSRGLTRPSVLWLIQFGLGDEGVETGNQLCGGGRLRRPGLDDDVAETSLAWRYSQHLEGAFPVSDVQVARGVHRHARRQFG